MPGNSTLLSSSLSGMREFYNSQQTKSYKFRLEKLKALKNALIKHEGILLKALFSDLKKSDEESYATEIGLIITELNVAIKNLRWWMMPSPANTNLVNLPSSSKIYHDPLGVVLVIAPWNYPLQLSLIPLIGAIAGGNCAVLKPSELAPATAAAISKLIAEIYQPGYIRVLEGKGEEIIPALMDSFKFDHIFYTGSIPVGRSIYELAAKQLIPVTLELGGKSPAIVYNDANISVAARRIVLGKYLNAGQTCIAPDYVLVHIDSEQELIKKIAETINHFYSDEPAQSRDYARIINEQRFDKLESYLQQGTIVTGGKTDRSKLYIAPTVLTNIPGDSTIMEEEIFGPILPILSFTSTEEAQAIVQRNPDPLAFYLFTNDKVIQKKWMQGTAFGGGCINNADWHFANHYLPFGGVGSSGMGSYHGKFSFETFTRKKPVMKTPAWFDPSIKYPPMKGRLGLFKWLFR